MANAEAGWYPDPDNAAQLRYFDGEMWTDHYHAAGAAGGAQPAAEFGGAPARTTGLTAPGDLLSDAWNGVKTRIGPLLGVSIGFLVVIGIFYALFFAWLFSRVDNFDDFDDIGDTIASFIIGYIIFLLIVGIVYSAYALIMARIMHQHHRGHQVSIGGAWDKVKTRLLAFFGTSVVLYIGFYIVVFILALILTQIGPAALILILVPMLFAWVKLGFLPISAVATRKGESMVSASTGVSEGRFFPIFGRMLMTMIPLIAAYVLGLILLLAAGENGGPLAVIGGLIIFVGALVGGLIHISGMVKLYLDAGAPSDL